MGSRSKTVMTVGAAAIGARQVAAIMNETATVLPEEDAIRTIRIDWPIPRLEAIVPDGYRGRASPIIVLDEPPPVVKTAVARPVVPVPKKSLVPPVGLRQKNNHSRQPKPHQFNTGRLCPAFR